MLTLAQHIALIQHALGKTPRSEHDLYATFNRAARALVNAHDWPWRSRGPVQIPAVPGQDWFDLPEDFGTLERVFIDNSAGSTGYPKLRLVTLDAIIRQRSEVNVSTGLDFLICFGRWNRSASSMQEPRQRAVCWPTPVTAGSPTITVYYDARWVDMSTSDTAAIPPIPAEMEQALILAGRAYATTLEFQQQAIEDPALAAEIERLKREFSREETSLGYMRGGAGDRYARDERIDARLTNGVDMN